jgi:hypothetical protein
MLSTSLSELFLNAAAADHVEEELAKEASDNASELLDDIDEALGETLHIEKRASRLGVAKVLAALDILANN